MPRTTVLWASSVTRIPQRSSQMRQIVGCVMALIFSNPFRYVRRCWSVFRLLQPKVFVISLCWQVCTVKFFAESSSPIGQPSQVPGEIPTWKLALYIVSDWGNYTVWWGKNTVQPVNNLLASMTCPQIMSGIIDHNLSFSGFARRSPRFVQIGG